MVAAFLGNIAKPAFSRPLNWCCRSSNQFFKDCFRLNMEEKDFFNKGINERLSSTSDFTQEASRS